MGTPLSAGRLFAVAILIAGLAAGPPSQAQSPVAAGHPLTLAEALNLAQVRAPSLQGADAGVRAADAGVQAAGLRPNPTLAIEAENVVGTGAYSGFDASETTTAISMPLELGGKRGARVRIAEAERAGAIVGATAARADLTLRTTQAFIALAAGERRRTAAKERQALAEQAARAAQLRVRAGKASPLEEQRAEVQRINANVDAVRAERAASVAAANLARLTGITPPIAITAPWFDTTANNGKTSASLASLAIAASDAQIAAANARLDAARRARMPDLTVSAGARRFSETGDTAAVVGLSIPLPLFNRGDAQIARARAELDRAEAERKALALDIEQSMTIAQAEVADAQATAAAANGPALAAANEAARIARIGYAEGKFSQLDLIEAERSLSQTREAAIDALAAFHDARARLARLHGRAAPLHTD